MRKGGGAGKRGGYPPHAAPLGIAGNRAVLMTFSRRARKTGLRGER